MKSGKYNILLFVLLLAAFSMYNCANQVSPGGGPRDFTPPKVLSSTPENNSTLFDAKRISISFDEYVTLKNPNQQVLISPPFKNKPEYRLRGKTLQIELDEELKENTTYTIFFGNAIVDLTEENPLVNYLYAFSTGSYIDSLAIGGEVVNAFDLQPQEDVFVMLFPKHIDTIPDDSIPMLTRPLYISKTDAMGQFQLRNLRNESYQIFALKDVNSNYLFDQPNEEIAFLDSLIIPEVLEPAYVDTLSSNDTLVAGADTLRADSVVVRQLYDRYYQLFMFQQIDSIQRMLDVEVFYPPMFRLNYSFPGIDPKFTVVNKEMEGDWKIEKLNRGRDSLYVWLKDMNLDSLQLAIADGDTILDTLMLVFGLEKEKAMRKLKGRKKDEDYVQRMRIKTNLRGGVLDLGKPFRLNMQYPLDSSDFSTTFFVAGNDTMMGAPFLATDSTNMSFVLDYEMVEDSRYEFIFPDSVFFDIYGLTNDSIQADFNTAKYTEYGTLILDIDMHDTPYVVFLMNKKEKVLQEIYVTKPQKLQLEYLKPGTYMVKAVQDNWRNKRWDTGIYVDKRQPENVFYFPVEIQIRANWDVEESWHLP